MRRDRFLEAVQEHLPMMRKEARRRGLDYDEAQEVVAKVLETILKKKKYRDLATPKDIRPYMRIAVRYERKNLQSTQIRQECLVGRLPDADLGDWAEVVNIKHREREEPVLECPFCFHANLNEYGACAMCHTIIPSHYRDGANVIRMSEASLAVDFHYDTVLDVQKALAQLTPRERAVVKANVMGNETFDSLGELTERDRMYLWRIWIDAKEKLQELLHEYGQKRLSKTSLKPFRDALQPIDTKGDMAA